MTEQNIELANIMVLLDKRNSKSKEDLDRKIVLDVLIMAKGRVI